MMKHRSVRINAMIEELYDRLQEVKDEDHDRIKTLLLLAASFGATWLIAEALKLADHGGLRCVSRHCT